MDSRQEFLAARDFLQRHRQDYAAAVAEFRWPRLSAFNWALDVFDAHASGNARPALWIVDEQKGETRISYAELRERSNRVANFLRAQGLKRGDRVLVMLDNVVPLWETVLAAMKVGAVVIPATTLLTPGDLADRLERGNVSHLVVDDRQCAKFAGREEGLVKIAAGGGQAPAGWQRFADAYEASPEFSPDGPTRATDPFLLYFTSGTTSRPKLVLHTHESYPVGHLSTMYWIGLEEGDIHLNISSPGWAKHAWSSFFAPWNAGATVLVHRADRFNARATLKVIEEKRVTTLCAPPTVWRLFIQEDLASYSMSIRELVGAGEPLNPEVISQVEKAWGIVIRDGYGQTETTAMVGNSPGQKVKLGSMGRPMPGYSLALLDAAGREVEEGEISVRLDPRPLGLMEGYLDDAERMRDVMAGGFYRTGDIARRDEDGYLWYVGRADDVFKSSDYRISPFELESVLIEHPAVAEAAVVPAHDPVRLTVPKAFVVLREGNSPDRETALALFRFLRQRLAPFKRIRRLEFAVLPKTISGKIRRVELRARATKGATSEAEFREEDFPELR